MTKETISAYLRRTNSDEAMVMKAALQEELLNLVNNDFVDVYNLKEAINYKQVDPMNSPIQMKQLQEPEEPKDEMVMVQKFMMDTANDILKTMFGYPIPYSPIPDENAARQQQILKDYLDQNINMNCFK